MTRKLFHEDKRKVRKIMLTRIQSGWVSAVNLAHWLNAPVKGPLGDRALMLEAIRLLREMNRLRAQGAPAIPDNSKQGTALRELWRALRRILDGLQPMYWEVQPWAWGYAIALQHPSALEAFFDWLSSVTTAGLLERLRQCKRCSKWFVARKEKKIFCSPDCQQDYWSEYRKTPEGQIQQAKQMACWRAKQKKKAVGKSISKATSRGKP
jgi:hypothetical protein